MVRVLGGAVLAWAIAATFASAAGAVSLPVGPGQAGSLYAFGSNQFGQLGTGVGVGGVTEQPMPVALPAGTRVVQVAVGSNHMLALTSTGEVYGWGDNAGGDLGQGGTDTTQQDTPVPIAFPEGTTIVSLDAGNGVSYAVTSAGEVYAWGGNSSGELGDGTRDEVAHATPQLVPGLSGVKEVSTNDIAPVAFTLALTETGQTYAWGSEYTGQLGNGVDSLHGEEYVLTPTAISGVGDVSQIATGGEYALAVTSTGLVYGWGYDYCGELGNGGSGCSGPGVEDTPVQVPIPDGEHITSVAAASVGPGHSLAASSAGTLYGWGGSEHSPTPISVPGDAAVAQVATGPNCNFALTTGALLYANGGSAGECGFGFQGSSLVSPLLEVPAPAGMKVAQVDGGGESGAVVFSPLAGTAPTVTGVSPSSGPATGANTVTIQGTGFARGAVVTFGQQVATNVAVSSSKLLSATAPAGSGTVDVTVTLEGATSPVTSADRYTYMGAASTGESGSGSTGPGSKGSASSAPPKGAGSTTVSTHGSSATVSGASFTLPAQVSCSNQTASSCTVTTTATVPASIATKASVASSTEHKRGKTALTIGGATTTFASGGSGPLQLTLTSRGLALLRSRHTLAITVTVRITGLRRTTITGTLHFQLKLKQAANTKTKHHSHK